MVGLGATLAACGGDSWFGGSTKVPIPGERVAVLQQEQAIEADPRLASLAVKLPAPVLNADWPQPGGTPAHTMQHLAGDGFAVAWRANAGSGGGRDGRISAPPIVADGHVFVMDAGTRLSAFDAARGTRQWTFDVEPDGDSAGGFGGGVTYDRGRLYVTTGYAQVIALDAGTGKEIWRQTLTAPLRAGPTVGGGRVIAVSVDNQVHALDAATGRKQWTHTGVAEAAGIYGGASPAMDGNTVIAALSSGELFALRADNARVLWADSLSGLLRTGAVGALSDIRGLPVIDRGQVFAASHGGRMVAIDLRSGVRLWEQNFGSLYAPWVAGDFVFVTTLEAQLLCVTRRDGRVRWARTLQRYRDEKARRGPIVWTGPVLVGDKLFLVNSQGDAVVISPTNGEALSTFSLPGAVSVMPIVANKIVYVLTDDAELVALH
jgi:outer membrane protein assembly factor BamB